MRYDGSTFWLCALNSATWPSTNRLLVSYDRSLRSYRWRWCIRWSDTHKSKLCEIHVDISENLIAHHGWARSLYLRIRNFDAWCHEVTRFPAAMSCLIHIYMCARQHYLSTNDLSIFDVRTHCRYPAKLQSDNQTQSWTGSNLQLNNFTDLINTTDLSNPFDI